jgi:hypothetical protein
MQPTAMMPRINSSIKLKKSTEKSRFNYSEGFVGATLFEVISVPEIKCGAGLTRRSHHTNFFGGLYK